MGYWCFGGWPCRDCRVGPLSDWWSHIKHFSKDEFKCKCGCNLVEMSKSFVLRLDHLRERMGTPLAVTSGYRCPQHNVQVSSSGLDGPHTTGRAADLRVMGHDAYRLLQRAPELGFTGIGVAQKGQSRFIHLDDLQAHQGRPRPWVWSY